MTFTTSSRIGPHVSVASLAVLPFVHLGVSADEEYFSDGLADQLSSALAKIRGLRVSARSSSFHFRGKDRELAEVARALNVETVLDGSVRKDGRHMVVLVRLVNVADGRRPWHGSYDRTLDDVFAVQDDIAQSVVNVLRTTTPGEGVDSEAGDVRAEVANAFKGRGTNVEAHLLFLRARHFFERYNAEDSARAIDCLEQAVGLEPDYALAWALLGDAHYRSAGYGWAPLADSRRQAREARERALAIEPDLLEGQLCMAAARHYDDRDHEGAQALLRKVLERVPGNTSALRHSGIIAMHAGRLEEAIGHYHRALEQDPLSARTHHSLAWCLHSIGRHVEAVAAYRKGLELAPRMVGSHALLSFVLIDLGRADEALAEAATEPNEAMRLYALACLQWTLGRREEADASLDQLIERLGDEAPSQIAGVYATRGELDEAFEWLDRAHRLQDPGLLELRNFPNFRPVRSDPRWGAFLRKAAL